MERPTIHPHYLIREASNQCCQRTHMTNDTTWTLEQVRQDPYMDLEGALPLDGMDTKLGTTKTIELGSIGGPELQPISGAT